MRETESKTKSEIRTLCSSSCDLHDSLALAVSDMVCVWYFLCHYHTTSQRRLDRIVQVQNQGEEKRTAKREGKYIMNPTKQREGGGETLDTS